jgi:outer membrane lipoprotein
MSHPHRGNRIATRFASIIAMASMMGCVAPTFDPAGAQTTLAPWEVAGKPLDNVDVIWGGVIIQVHHFDNDSEVEVLAFPLDRGQRPIPRAPSQGRFRIRIPGYVEAVDFPEGLFLSARGRLIGTRDGSVGKTHYVYPIITDAQIRRWPSGYQFDQTRWSVGIGVIL